MNGILLIDKQSGFTSHDLVRRVRKLLGVRSVGHAGTLDPLATGLLVLGVGEGTKLLHYLQGDDKRYLAKIALGTETDSLDADGVVVARAAVPEGLDNARVLAAAQSFVGTYAQRVPLISAVKVQGRALHQRARAGESIEAPIREVCLREVIVHSVCNESIELELQSGKGFYVRSFARDLCESLGTKGHIRALRRIQSGVFHVEDAFKLEAAPKDAEQARAWLEDKIIPLPEACRGFLRAHVNAQGAADTRHGRPVRFDDITEAADAFERQDAPIAVFSQAEELLAVAKVEQGALQVQRGFN